MEHAKLPGVSRGDLALALTLCSILAGASASAQEPSGERQPIVRIDSGAIQGLARGDVWRFLGIPYASPPLGPLRWHAPVAVKPWKGVRAADTPEPACPQLDPQNMLIGSEDCLKLSVTVPRAAHHHRLPVMAFLHGGGFVSDSAGALDPTRLASEGNVVVITMEFRLGVLGYMAPTDSADGGSYGLLDQRAALQWVQRNIAAFGGDPSNVTLFGESGGAVAVCAQLVSPGSNGLFGKAIMESGSCGTTLLANAGGPGTPALPFFRPRAQVHADTIAAARELGCDGDEDARLRCLDDTSLTALLPLTSRFAAAAYGGETLPLEPSAALASGRFLPRPVLDGIVSNEAGLIVNVFLVYAQPIDDTNLDALLAAGFGSAKDAVIGEYPRSSYATAADLWSAAYSDAMFACPLVRANAALATRAPVYSYEFADDTVPHDIPALPNAPGGAWHADELTYLFDQPGRPVDFDNQLIPLTDTQRAVASDVIAGWSSFARDGRPRLGEHVWPQWRSGQTHRITAQPNSHETADLALDHHCAFWITASAQMRSPLPARRDRLASPDACRSLRHASALDPPPDHTP